MIASRPDERVLPAAVGRDRVIGEHLGHFFPQLLVEAPQVLVLDALDGLDVDQVVQSHGRIVVSSAAGLIELHGPEREQGVEDLLDGFVTGEVAPTGHHRQLAVGD